MTQTLCPLRSALLSLLVRPAHTLLVLALELLEHFVSKQLVGDMSDFFGLFPGVGQRCELALQCATLDVFVRRHLEREAIDCGKAIEGRRLVAPGAAASRSEERRVGKESRARRTACE